MAGSKYRAQELVLDVKMVLINTCKYFNSDSMV
jgi:hypothetical protein